MYGSEFEFALLEKESDLCILQSFKTLALTAIWLHLQKSGCLVQDGEVSIVKKQLVLRIPALDNIEGYGLLWLCTQKVGSFCLNYFDWKSLSLSHAASKSTLSGIQVPLVVVVIVNYVSPSSNT